MKNKANGPADCCVTEMLQFLPTETVYEVAHWFDKRLKGECRAPEAWKILRLVFLKKQARQLKPVDICCLPLCDSAQAQFLSGTTVRRSRAWHTRARRLLRAHHGSSPPMSKTWENGKCGRKNTPHRRKCQTWNCRERGPGQEDGGHEDCGCVCRDAVHVELYVVGSSNNRGRAVASPSLRRVPSQLWWRRRPRSSMPSSDRMQSMSR